MDQPHGSDDACRAGRRRARLALAIVVLAALLLRVPGLLEGEWAGNRDELNYVPKAVRMAGGDPNPHYFHNPPLATVLMLGGIGVRWAAGRVTGEFGSAVDFKARFLLDGAGAFAAARTVSLLLGLATVVEVAALAGALSPRGPEPRPGTACGVRVATFAGLLAATGLAVSPLHAERSAMATNEALVTLTYTFAVHAAVVLARTATLRAAITAGALAGLAGASKYTGALACVPVAAAALLCVPSGPARRDASDSRATPGGGSTTSSLGAHWPRTRLLLAATVAAAAGFVVACPWSLCDAETFWSHVLEQSRQKDRWQDGRAWLRYAETAWTTGLGKVWSVLALAGICAAVAAALRRVESARPALVAVIGVAAPAAFLASQTDLAYGRYLLPVYPAAIALGAAWVASWRLQPVWPRRLAAAAVGLAAAASFPEAWALFAEARMPTTRQAAAAWIREHVPDGARVIGDWDLPRLPSSDDRESFRGKVSPAVWELFTPAWRTGTAWDYFARPVNRVPGTDVAVDDVAGLRAIGPVWIVTSSGCERPFALFPPADYPPQRWYALVRRETELVHEVRGGGGLRGPDLRIGLLR